jgi:hypothetical protein
VESKPVQLTPMESKPQALRSVFKIPTTANVVEAKAPVVETKVAANVVEARKERYAFAIIHFGSNPVYLELENVFFQNAASKYQQRYYIFIFRK